ncbi:Imm21 family immunity protein [Streptomyces sp. NPDC059215]|uniref:Imm21 family immunity protein n=1 Tax=Streptomyces sp. NPDC059215 TaxID=3346772 RepID=UPI0036B9300C
MDSENSWVTSAGGPLILIPESVCYQWAAAPCTYPDNEGDYGRTCEVDGYVGLIDVGGAQALVLGDMPARTTFLPRHNVLVREIAGGEDDAGLSDLVANLIPRVEWETGPTWTVSEPVVLFDSAYQSTEIATEEHLRIDLPTGAYVIEAGYIEPSSEYLILVRLLRDHLPLSTDRAGQPSASDVRGDLQC